MLWFLKNFTRLNNWLRSEGFTVEEDSYAEISKKDYMLFHTTFNRVAPAHKGGINY
jgi:hypothetical protein